MEKTVFVTGASSGIGRECVKVFIENGWRAVACARRAGKLEELKNELQSERLSCLTVDVRDRSGVETAFSKILDEFSYLDVLVNNAGLALGLEPAHQASMEDWETMIDTNIKGLIYCTRAALPGMVERNAGTIVNVGSISGDWPYPGGNVYGATKAFVKQFSRNLRVDLLGTKVRVCNIEPGMTETEFSLVRLKGDSERASKVYQNANPLTGRDIADIIYWAAASAPEHVNVNRIEVMPVSQAWQGFAVARKESR